MRYFWTARGKFLESLRLAGRVFLLFDFDGTLAPIVIHPARARLPIRSRRALVRLGRRPQFVIGIVTGRTLADIRRRARLTGAFYVGSHGFEYVLPGGRPVSLSRRAWFATLRRLRRRLRELLQPGAGLRWESKTYSLALHYREVGPAHVANVLRGARRIAKEFGPAARLQHGKKLVEFLPNVGVTKATTVRQVLSRLTRGLRRSCAVVCFGDDLTDEPVFRAVGRQGWSVWVGGNRARTAARYYLRSPAEVTRWLEWLVEVTR
jgi:trehalose-phosphatase